MHFHFPSYSLNFLTSWTHATSQETSCSTDLVNTENNTALPLSVPPLVSMTLSNHHSASPVGRAPQFQTCYNYEFPWNVLKQKMTVHAVFTRSFKSSQWVIILHVPQQCCNPYQYQAAISNMRTSNTSGSIKPYRRVVIFRSNFPQTFTTKN